MGKPRLLMVDDEQTVLAMYVSLLGAEYDVQIAASALEALEMLGEPGQYAVVVSDMNMPELSGLEFLARVQKQAPDAIRIMVTGDLSQKVAVDAANRGQVFRFLNKPFTRSSLTGAIRDGLEECRRRLAEKELLAGTANGCIDLLGDILAVVSPLAFAKARRVARTIEQVGQQLNVTDAWELTMAATLSHLGCIAVPDKLVSRVARREPLSHHSVNLWRAHPQLAHDLIARIPRLERVAEIVLAQQRPYEPSATDELDVRHSVSWRAACLGAGLEYDTWIELSDEPEHALSKLEQSAQSFPKEILDAFAEVMRIDMTRRSRLVMINEICSGMVLLENLVDRDGRVLLTNGQQISDWHITRLFGLGYASSLRQPVRVLCPATPAKSARIDAQQLPPRVQV